MLIVTTNDVAGYRVVRHLGVVRGITVRSAQHRRQYWGDDPGVVRRQYHSLYHFV
jgi:uncharacterized protein YbjQ (UPF0145 family)